MAQRLSIEGGREGAITLMTNPAIGGLAVFARRIRAGGEARTGGMSVPGSGYDT